MRRKFQKVRKIQVPCEKEIQEMANQCGKEVGICRKIAAMYSPWIPTPMIYGSIRPKILLPEKILLRES